MTNVIITSYGVRHDDPPPDEPHVELDLTQALRNPHDDPAMRYLTGRDEQVRRHVLNTPGANDVIRNLLHDAITALIAGHIVEDYHANLGSSYKATVHVHVYCQGGRHRSVAVAEEAARLLPEAAHFYFSGRHIQVRVEHRHIARPVLPATNR